VLLSDALWRRRFGADRSIIGRRVALDGDSYEVVGVLPAMFVFPNLNQLMPMTVAPEQPQIWKPFALTDRERAQFGDFNFICIGRLRDGVSPDAARVAPTVRGVVRCQRGAIRRAPSIRITSPLR
jgi:putative ABC transport system permease protein